MSTNVYDFAIESFTISNTRSRHEDTDFVSASLAVAGRPALSTAQSLGNLNNGTYPTQVRFTAVPVADNETAVFSYVMVNNGHSDPGTVMKTLEDAVQKLATSGANAAASAAGDAIGATLGASIGTAIVPIIGSALGALAGWLVSEAGYLVFADCDGAVAAAVHILPGSEIPGLLKGAGVMYQDDHHPGTDSPAGCGSNSVYDVKWFVTWTTPPRRYRGG